MTDITIKTTDEVEKMREAGRLAAEVLDMIGSYVKAGVSTDELNAGAATFGNGTTGIVGPVTAANSLVGTTAFDNLFPAVALVNGNYVVPSPNWHNGALAVAGAVTFGNGTTGVSRAESIRRKSQPRRARKVLEATGFPGEAANATQSMTGNQSGRFRPLSFNLGRQTR